MADILNRTFRSTVLLEESSSFRFEQEYYKKDVSFTKQHHARVVLGVSMSAPSALDMAGITTGKSLLLTTDREIKVGIDQVTNLITISESGMFALVGEFTAVYVLNESPDYEASVEFAFTD